MPERWLTDKMEQQQHQTSFIFHYFLQRIALALHHGTICGPFHATSGVWLYIQTFKQMELVSFFSIDVRSCTVCMYILSLVGLS